MLWESPDGVAHEVAALHSGEVLGAYASQKLPKEAARFSALAVKPCVVLAATRELVGRGRWITAGLLGGVAGACWV